MVGIELFAKQLVENLGLARHPEGGWYRETYRADESLTASALPARFEGERAICTAIYFMLEQGDVSALHRIKSDELWHFYAGTPLVVHLIAPGGAYQQICLGADLVAGEKFQAVVPAGCWFGAELSGEGDYSLVGCTVAPGFDFNDFEMASRDELLADYPAHEKIIRRLT